MDNDQDVTVDTSTEVEETTDSNESDSEVALTEETEEVVPKKQYDQVFARARKAEKELKESKATPTVNNDPFFEERLELLASGLSRDEVDKAKVIALGNKTTLAEALKDDMFIAYQSKIKDDKRKEAAKLGASKGSGESQDNTLIKPEMTRDEHVEAFNKVMGR